MSVCATSQLGPQCSVRPAVRRMLAGKSALITGSLGGIGFASAKALAMQDCNVMVNGAALPIDGGRMAGRSSRIQTPFTPDRLSLCRDDTAAPPCTTHPLRAWCGATGLGQRPHILSGPVPPSGLLIVKD